ncbi:MAG: hypothetical protein BGO26_07545 [Actinobacteria bacterium 69-20]|nr:MAG: hypothetical protein BGO26_07545 [Actinobacteria bacterium 69-20]
MPQPRYTHGHHESVLRSHTWRTAENSAGYLLPHLRPGMSLLDVGCGPGTITIDLARRVAPSRVVGIDPSAEVLEQARAAADEARADVEFLATGIDGWAHPSGPFDVVHAHQVLQHLPDPVVALRQMRSLCVPGGFVAARDADYSGMFWYPRIPELDEWLRIYHDVARGNGGEPDAGRHLSAWARAAGFRDVTVTASIWCFASEPERRWWGGLWADRVVASDLAEAALTQGRASRTDLGRIADGWRRWVGAPDAFFAVPHAEILCRP